MMRRVLLLLAAIAALGALLSTPQVASTEAAAEPKSRVGAFDRDSGERAGGRSSDLPAKRLVSTANSGEIASAYLVAAGVGTRIGPKTTISSTRRQHVLDRHSWSGPLSADRSKFVPGSNLDDLVARADTVTPIPQAGTGNLQRTVHANQTVGFDRNVGQFTSTYTVITKPGGELVTAFPGVPGPAWPP